MDIVIYRHSGEDANAIEDATDAIWSYVESLGFDVESITVTPGTVPA